MKKNEYNPNKVFHPGETLKEKLNEMNITIEVFSKISNINVNKLKNIIECKDNIDNDIANKLEEHLKIPKSFWLNLQKMYENRNTKKHHL